MLLLLSPPRRYHCTANPHQPPPPSITLPPIINMTTPHHFHRTLQQNVFSVTNFSEENFFVTKKYHLAMKFIFHHYLLKKIVTFSDEK